MSVVPWSVDRISSWPPFCRSRSRMLGMPTPTKVPSSGPLRPPRAGNSTAPIPNLKDDLRRVTFEANLGAVASRMTDDVEQRFLNDEKQVSFQHRRQALHDGRSFHHDLKAAACFESADEPAHGRLEANLVEHRRVEQI